MPFKCEKCKSEVIIKIVAQLAIPTDNLYCPLCGAKALKGDFAHAVFGT